jgi:hypothetical protein
VVLAPVDERGVEAERDVVQEAALAGAADVDPPFLAVERLECGEWVVPVEPEVARKVVARPVRHDDERQAALGGHGRNRAVAAGRAEHVGLRRPRELRGVVVLAQHVSVDPARPRRLGQLVRRRVLGARARVDQEEAAHPPHAIGQNVLKVRPNGSLRAAAAVPIMNA